MTEATLAAGGAFALLSAAVYAFVGWSLSQRKVSPDAQLAARLFSVWWVGLAATTAAGGMLTLAAAAGIQNLAIHVTITHVNLLAICAALWGLLYYLLYLFTGKRGIFYPLTAFYAVYYVGLIYFVNVSDPIGIEVRRWNVALDYANDITGLPLQLLVAFLVLPQFFGAAAYLTLYRKVKEPTQKYRIALVGLSILIWFGSAYAGAAAGLGTSDTWQVVTRVIALGASLTIYFAYHPPGFVRRRGIASVRDERGTGPYRREGAATPPRTVPAWAYMTVPWRLAGRGWRLSPAASRRARSSRRSSAPGTT
jgi:hypothetical protein